MQIDRNDFGGIDQRMTSLFDQDVTVLRKGWSGAFHLFGKHGFGKDEIELGQDVEILGQGKRLLGGEITEHGQDLFNLFLLLHLQFADLIVQFYDRCRFDKQRGTGR